jgi:hypothetical protein
MKTAAKVGIGCLVVLVFACIIAIVVFFFGGHYLKSKIASFTATTSKYKQSVEVLQQLNSTYPFTRPADGQIPEDRMESYIRVCGAVHDAIEPYSGWIAKHKEGGSNGLGDAKTSLKVLYAVASSSSSALSKAHMSPVEFNWIHNTIEAAAQGGASGSSQDMKSQMNAQELQFLQQQAARPDLSPSDRKELEARIQTLKQKTAAAAPSGNAALYQKYKDQLKQVSLPGFVFGVVMGSGAGLPKPS